MQTVGLAIISYCEESCRLGCCVGTPRPKWRRLVGRDIGVAEAFTRCCVEKTDGAIEEANTLENVDRSDGDALECFDRLIEGKSDRGLA